MKRLVTSVITRMQMGICTLSYHVVNVKLAKQNYVLRPALPLFFFFCRQILNESDSLTQVLKYMIFNLRGIESMLT